MISEISLNERIFAIFKSLNSTQKITQKDFAKKIGVDQSYISQIFKKNSDKKPSDRTLKLICTQFNVNEEWLLEGKGTMFNKTNLELAELLGERIKSLSDFQINAMKTLINLPPEHVEILMSIIKSLNGGK
jgi:transcriptional regulator with XRE-family HTH domain